jgi:transcriptional regulator with XRE-family HTH domain
MLSEQRRQPSTNSFDTVSRIGELVRQWRTLRHLTQLELALEAGISARHLSFIESGKALPSREMVTQLAEALAIPLRERNALFLAAGFAPTHRETGLAQPEMALINRAIEFILKQQEPYPALVLNRHWDITRANEGAAAFMNFVFDTPPDDPNMIRQIFSDHLLRPFIANWDEVASDLIRRLHHEIDWAPTDEKLRALLEFALANPHVPEKSKVRPMEVPMSPTLNFVIRKNGVELSFFSTWTSFAAPHDVTLDELRIESSFPADDASARLWERIIAGDFRR